MKSVILIQDGIVQVILTPETKHENSVVDLFADKSAEVNIYKGSFYECRGGWVRQSTDDTSLILKATTTVAKDASTQD